MWRSSDLTGPASALLARVAADDWGQVAGSHYDTGRLVALAPWLPGHDERVEFLLRSQHSDGGWGGPDGYAVVPTLSATAALLAESRRAGHRRALPAARDGLAALRRWLGPGDPVVVPDTIGVEVIVPALLEDLAGADVPAPRLPDGFDPRPLAAVRRRAAAGTLPQRAWACLEVVGDDAVAAPWVRPAGGAVGCSAAATAAWVGGPDGDPAAVGFLDRLQRRGGGPVPGVTPITYFEPAWVLNSLAVGGLDVPVPAVLLDRLEAGLTATGAPAAPGLPADSDDTAAVLSALSRHGRRRRPDSLLGYRTDGYFACFLDERNPSITANAHVLEAFALHLRACPEDGERFAGPAAAVAAWLLGHQRPDGSWSDKWHASDYYATACCVLALALHGGEPARRAVAAAAALVRETQRPDGSWGRWEGTVEETAYAVQVLATAAREGDAGAVRRGCEFLAGAVPTGDGHPPLWHAKDLYTPVTVVEAARLAALAMGRRVAAD